jgi:hypothetical protein
MTGRWSGACAGHRPAAYLRPVMNPLRIVSYRLILGTNQIDGLYGSLGGSNPWSVNHVEW